MIKRPVVIAHKRTREIIKRFETTKEAAESFGNSRDGFIKSCKARGLSDSFWYARYEDEFDPDEDFTGRSNCPAAVIDLETRRVFWFPTRYAAADFMGVSRSYISQAVRKGRTIDDRFRVMDAGRRLK